MLAGWWDLNRDFFHYYYFFLIPRFGDALWIRVTVLCGAVGYFINQRLLHMLVKSTVTVLELWCRFPIELGVWGETIVRAQVKLL